MTPAQMTLLAEEVVRLLLPKLTTAEVAIAPERYLTAQEAAVVLGISQPTIERLTRAGTIPSHKLGRCRRYLASELRAAQHAAAQDRETQTAETTTAALAPARRAGSAWLARKNP